MAGYIIIAKKKVVAADTVYHPFEKALTTQ
jgi:hypothetical protein